ncbi:MAG: hypothetical protein QJR08_04360 [Bacillota bacterium]|nr:hypothetical protein [Bacillota bacterium]
MPQQSLQDLWNRTVGAPGSALPKIQQQPALRAPAAAPKSASPPPHQQNLLDRIMSGVKGFVGDVNQGFGAAIRAPFELLSQAEDRYLASNPQAQARLQADARRMGLQVAGPQYRQEWQRTFPTQAPRTAGGVVGEAIGSLAPFAFTGGLGTLAETAAGRALPGLAGRALSSAAGAAASYAPIAAGEAALRAAAGQESAGRAALGALGETASMGALGAAAPLAGEALGRLWSRIVERAPQATLPKAEEAVVAPQKFTLKRGAPASKLVLQQAPEALKPGVTTRVPGQLRRDQIIRQIEQRFGVPVRTGRYPFGQQTLGVANTTTGVIRLRDPHDIQAASHELAHILDRSYNLSGTIGKLPEVQALASGGDPAKEGVAEFFRRYLTNPDQIRAQAPEAVAQMEAALARTPDVQAAVQELQRQVSGWASLPPVDRVKLSMASGADKPPAKSLQDLIGHVQTDWVDKFHPIYQAETGITGGRLLGVRDSPYQLARLAAGAAGQAEAFLRSGYLLKDGVPQKVTKGLEEILRPVQQRLDDFAAYLYARRAEELWQKGVTEKPALSATGEIVQQAARNPGISLEDARATIQALDSPEFRQAAQELYQFQDALLQHLVDHGLVDPQAADAMRVAHQNYIPLYRVLDDPRFGGPSAGKGFGNVPEPIKRLKGSSRTIVNPLESVIKNTYAYITAAARNDVAAALVGLAREPDAGRWVEIVRPKMSLTRVSAQEFLRTLARQGVDLSWLDAREVDRLAKAVANIFRPLMKPAPGERVMTALVGGRPVLLQIGNDALYEALTALSDGARADLLMKLVTAPASILRAGATLVPYFPLRNLIRDVWDATVFSRYGFKPWDAIRGLAHALKRDDLYWQWYASGGAHAVSVYQDRDYARLLQEITRSPQAKALGIIRHPIELLRAFSELTESATRLGEFERALRATGNPLQAALDSRQITIDFARAGRQGQKANRIIAFWNAAIQEPSRLAQAWRKDPVGFNIRALAYITLPSVALWMVNRNDPTYRELPEWRRDTMWNLHVGNTWVSIPKPFLLGWLYGTLPEKFLEWASGQGIDPGQVLGSFWSQLSPGYLPTALQPWLAYLTNWDLFFGRPVVPRSEQNLLPAEQYGPGTSETAKLLGRGISALPGMRYSPAASPRMIDELIYGYTGGLGRMATQGIDALLLATGAANEPPAPSPTPADRPIIGAFVARGPAEGSSQSINDFYEELNRAQMEYEAARAHGGMTAEINARYKSLNRVATQLSKLRKQIEQVQNSRVMTPDQKRQRIAALNLQMVNLARKALGREPLPTTP